LGTRGFTPSGNSPRTKSFQWTTTHGHIKSIRVFTNNGKKIVMTNYEVLSPDGFTIEFDKPYYTSKEKAMTAFNEWKERYRRQGYYSSNNGRISLDELEKYCTFNKI
jgi:hypothetical protein